MLEQNNYLEKAKGILKYHDYSSLQKYLKDRGFSVNVNDTWNDLYEAASLDYAELLEESGYGSLME